MERIEFIDNLIRHKATGNLKSFSKKLNLSRSHTLEFLKEMKDCGFPIEYSRTLNSYYYSEDGKFAKNLFLKNDRENNGVIQGLSNDEMKRISGGKTFFNFFIESDYIRLRDLNLAQRLLSKR